MNFKCLGDDMQHGDRSISFIFADMITVVVVVLRNTDACSIPSYPIDAARQHTQHCSASG